MQRAVYLSQLYESISSIPPDLQQCLLTIAQYGCDSDQVKRWYNLVRNHFGIPQAAPPTALSQKTPHPMSKTREPNTPELIGGRVKMEPPVTPDFRAQGQYQDPGSWTSPVPPLTNSTQYSTVNALPVQSMFTPPTLLPRTVIFTGHGLAPTHDELPSGNFNSDLIAKSPAVPLLSPFDDKFKPSPVSLSPRAETVAPSSVLLSSPEQVKPARKRRKLAKKPAGPEDRATMEPPPRPRRPSIPFRSHEQQFQHLPALGPAIRDDSIESRPDPARSLRPLQSIPAQGPYSFFEDLYIPGQLHQPSRDVLPWVLYSSGLAKTQNADDTSHETEKGSEQPPLYQSPYRGAQHVVSSC